MRLRPAKSDMWRNQGNRLFSGIVYGCSSSRPFHLMVSHMGVARVRLDGEQGLVF